MENDGFITMVNKDGVKTVSIEEITERTKESLEHFESELRDEICQDIYNFSVAVEHREDCRITEKRLNKIAYQGFDCTCYYSVIAELVKIQRTKRTYFDD